MIIAIRKRLRYTKRSKRRSALGEKIAPDDLKQHGTRVHNGKVLAVYDFPAEVKKKITERANALAEKLHGQKKGTTRRETERTCQSEIEDELKDFIQSICGWGYGAGHDFKYNTEQGAAGNGTFVEAVAQANKFRRLGIIDDLIGDEAEAFKSVINGRF